jgi:hypothetical protein
MPEQQIQGAVVREIAESIVAMPDGDRSELILILRERMCVKCGSRTPTYKCDCDSED